MKKADDNNKEKRGTKRIPIIFGAAVIVILAAVGVILMSNGHKSDNQDEILVASGSGESQPTSIPTSTPEPASTPNPTPEPTPTPASTPEPTASPEISEIICYTSIECDEQSLKELVIATLHGADDRIRSYRDKHEDFDALVSRLEAKGYNRRSQLDGQFEAPEGYQWENGSLSVFDVSGCVGTTISDGLDDNWFSYKNYIPGKGYLANMVAFGLYREKVETDDLIVEAGDTISFDIDGTEYNINFEVSFEQGENTYVALIGNVDGVYKVLDIVNAHDLEGVNSAMNVPSTAQNGNGGGQSSSGDTPSANPENTPTDNVSNQGDGRDNRTNPGLVTEPDGSMHPQVGHRWDDNNPSFPVYEGPKEGYAWNNVLGYIPWDGGTGTTQTGNDMAGDQSPCVFDENGNCTVHQHSGY